jgi:cellobiose phosphorylase
VHQVDILIKPSEQKKLIFILGYQENMPEQKFNPPSSQIINKESVKPSIFHFLDPSNVEQAFQDLQKHWEKLLDKFQVTTEDIHTNRMINIWNAYQVVITFYLSRSASYFESGISRGIGFRDSNQDLLGVVHLIPERARERILDLAATQLPDGGAYHQYQPLTKRGNNDIGSNFNDDPLWLVLSTAAYIKETGDYSILEESIPYDFQPDTAESLLGHLHRSIQYTLDRLGPHNLPLIGRADWNDCLNLNCFSDSPGQSFQTTTNKEGDVAESIFIAGLFVLVAKEMADLVEYYQGIGGSLPMDTIPPSHFYSEAASKMEDAIWAAGWDGSWFRRAYDSFGQVLGSQTNEQGRLFIEPQGVCIMAGLGLNDGRALQALDATAEHLATPHGLVLHQPAFNQYYLHLGEISSYPPGYKENAGIFCHTNPWIMIAETMIGRGDKAYDYYLRINPSNREKISDVHKTEPYVYSQMIAGKDAQTFGEAKNSWLTGTAAWNYVAITQWILGIRPSYLGLEIDPVIPTSWNDYQVIRIFRGTKYDIQFERIGVGKDLQIIVDGTTLEGNILPLPSADTNEIKVKVVLGSE